MSEEMKFEVVYCVMCETNCVVCPKCGNNTCNGGYGYLDENGEPTDDWNNAPARCDICPLAYQYSHDAVWSKELPKAGKEICREELKIMGGIERHPSLFTGIDEE